MLLKGTIHRKMLQGADSTGIEHLLCVKVHCWVHWWMSEFRERTHLRDIVHCYGQRHDCSKVRERREGDLRRTAHTSLQQSTSFGPAT